MSTIKDVGSTNVKCYLSDRQEAIENIYDKIDKIFSKENGVTLNKTDDGSLCAYLTHNKQDVEIYFRVYRTDTLPSNAIIPPPPSIYTIKYQYSRNFLYHWNWICLTLLFLFQYYVLDWGIIGSLISCLVVKVIIGFFISLSMDDYVKDFIESKLKKAEESHEFDVSYRQICHAIRPRQ